MNDIREQAAQIAEQELVENPDNETDRACNAIVRNIAAAIRALPDGWRDIAEAPAWDEDVTILVYGGRYIPMELIRSDGDYWNGSGKLLKARPTKFMRIEPPLPNAPK